ncbi:ATP-binding protein [Deltaproteobacteria bacterium TL4]
MQLLTSFSRLSLKKGIGHRFAIDILLFSSVVTLVGTLLQLGLDYVRDVDLIETRIEQVHSSYLPSLSNGLWVNDIKSLRLQLEGIYQLPDMQYLEIRSEENKVLAVVGSPQNKHTLQHFFPLKYSYRGSPVYLGQLLVVATLDGVYQRLIEKVFTILATQTIKTFLVSLFIIFLYQLLVGRYLKEISDYAEEVQTGQWEHPLILARKPSKNPQADELTQLVAAFNDLRLRAMQSNALFIKEKQLAVAANEAKSLFVANISHETRTPLNVILGHVQNLNNDQTMKQQHRRALKAMLQAGSQLMEILNDILNISKIESGTLKLHPVSFRLLTLVQSVASIFETTCRDKNLQWKLHTNFDPQLRVFGDQQKLRQILTNFLGNAVKFTDFGSVTLKVEAEAQNWYRFVVQDTGPGIAEAEQKHIFDSFYQTKAGYQKGGTGLGLSIARKLTQLMGGKLALTSKQGEGCLIEVKVPLSQTETNTNRESLRSTELFPSLDTFEHEVVETSNALNLEKESGKSSTKAEGEPFDPSQVEQLLKETIFLLHNNRFRAWDVLESLLSLLPYPKFRQEKSDLNKALSRLDSEGSLLTLMKLCEQLNIFLDDGIK